MPMTTDFRDCQKFATAITAAGGRLPNPLAHLLSAYEVLNAAAATQRPETDILTHALNGTLDSKKLAELAPAAATADMVNGYCRQLADRSAHVLLGEWHRAMKAGAADEVLNSLRPSWDRHRAAIAEARSLIDPESSAEQVIASGKPELVTAWQQLGEHLQAVQKIGAIAAQFGPRLGSFPQITEYAQGEGGRLDDRAIMATAGPIMHDSALFQRPDQGHRTSPWFRTNLKLHTIESARERYNAWAAEQFDAVHSGPRGGWLDQATGQVHPHPAPVNPYRKQKVST
jgi:hypothetical protein